jgi:predicted PurR-regulated permease PerM
MGAPIEQIEYPTETADLAEGHAAAVTRRERRGAISAMSVAIVLLAALCGIAAVGVARLSALVERTESLIVEQQRTTCYERLQWLGDSFADHPESGDLRVAASRSCEGDEPLVEFEPE